jgi:hypothetical protein
MLTVTAKDAAGNTGTAILTVTYDATPPTVSITTPTSGATYTATSSPLTVGGTASDNIGVTQVTWSNSAGGSGTATGTTSWTASGIALQSGTNVITVTALDAASNASTTTLTVSYAGSSSGPIAAYAFSEGSGTTSADATGDGYTATLFGGPAWVQGHTGTALSFNGTSSYATVPNLPYLSTWTVSGWVWSPTAPANANPSGPIHHSQNFHFSWNHSNPAFIGTVALSVGGAWYPASFGPLAANTWYYLAATYDGETLKSYVNGALVTSNPGPSGPPDADPFPFTLGKHSQASQFFQGIVDDVRVYSRALTLAEIQNDMNTAVGVDTTAPIVIITTPTSTGTYGANTSPLTIAGTASDSGGVAHVTWSNSAGGSGTATGTTSWSVGSIALQPGTNVLTVTAQDAAGNNGSATLTVTYDPTAPTIAITSPTTGATYTTGTSPLTLSGTAGDNVLVTQVTWSNSTGGSGTATGTTSWSVSGIALQSGTNVLTITATDDANNTATATLTVNYTGTDTTGPVLAITSPTNNQVVNTTPINLEGTATDAGRGNSGISSVRVNGGLAAGGTATGAGTAQWTSTVTLSPGPNSISVVASDNSASQNATTAQITITYDATPPTLAITIPTTGATFSTNSSPIALAGTASDNFAVTQVTWSTSTGASGTAGGTGNWTANGIPLQAGTNVITVTAHDGANNTSTATLTVTYSAPAGLVAAYGFNEGSGTATVDSSGNGYNATLEGGPAWVAGVYGLALGFDGVSSFGTASGVPYLPAWTVSGWVKSPAAPTNGAPSGPIHHSQNFHFNWNHSNPAFMGTAALSVGGVWYGASFGSLAANTWYFLAATYDGKALNAYSNGVLMTSNTSMSGPADQDPAPLTFGKHSQLSQYFQGTVDEVRIYNRALTMAEIRSDMNSPTPPPDTVPPTIAITAPSSGATVSGTVTASANASDNVAVAGVQFLLDNQPLGIQVTSPPYNMFWNTAGVANGSHLLGAVATDTSGNQTSTVINVTVSNTVATDPATVGQWSAPFALPIKDVHMILFRTGDVMMWDAFDLGYQAYLWTPSTGAFTNELSADNIFCSAPAVQADGSALIAGGHVYGGVGIPDVNRFDPISKTWSSLAPMAFARWYPTATSLSDGRVLVIGGSTTCFTCIADIPEVYDPTTNTWTQLGSAALDVPLYPQTFLLPDGRILLAAATEGIVQAQTLNLNTQTWTVVDPALVNGGSSVMYRPSLILKSGTGSAPPPRAPVAASEFNAYVLDMTQPSPAWTSVGAMAYPRTYHTLTMLPDGKVLATGGSETTDPGSQPVYAAEIWDPQTLNWSVMSSMQMARTYHETALLLPDGRVLVGGGGGCCNAPDQMNAEIFSPPYLFKGARPTISAAPSTVSYGTQFVVTTPNAASISSAVLIRNGAVTHQMDRSQNYVPLAFSVGSGTLNVQMPSNRNLAPPGDYMLFIVNGGGVPSVASMMTIH